MASASLRAPALPWHCSVCPDAVQVVGKPCGDRQGFIDDMVGVVAGACEVTDIPDSAVEVKERLGGKYLSLAVQVGHAWAGHGEGWGRCGAGAAQGPRPAMAATTCACSA